VLKDKTYFPGGNDSWSSDRWFSASMTTGELYLKGSPPIHCGIIYVIHHDK